MMSFLDCNGALLASQEPHCRLAAQTQRGSPRPT